MPIPIAPTKITVEQVTKSTVTADKLHIISLLVRDPTKEKPSLELQGVPYVEDVDGNKQFSSEILTIRTGDVYAAIANLGEAGLNKTALAMQAIFEAAAEMVQYRAACEVDMLAANTSLQSAKADYQTALENGDATDIAAKLVLVQDAVSVLGKAALAFNDPANLRVV